MNLLINFLYTVVILNILCCLSASNGTQNKTSMGRLKLDYYGGTEVKLGMLKHHVFLVKLTNKLKSEYRAFCSGSIIKDDRVLSSAHCFYTNRKRFKHTSRVLKAVGGILTTYVQHSVDEDDDVQQWRTIGKVYTQKFFRFPAYNLAVVEIDKPWNFNQFVNKIPYASLNQNFDGVCLVTAVRPARSWSSHKFLFTEAFKMLPRSECESKLLRDSRLYFCTEYDSRKLLMQSVESEGSALICTGTGDPQENDSKQGLLVGVTSLIYTYLPTLHHKVGPFHKWVTDTGYIFSEISTVVLLFCMVIKLLL